MLKYDFGDGVTGFSTEVGDLIDYEIIVPILQAHGTKAAIIKDPSIIPDTYGVDAIVTTVKGVTIGVKTADCVPILIYDSYQKVIAAIHSGWKGTIANITKCVIELMRKEFGSSPTDIKAVIGPCIHVESFEVGDEVYIDFKNKGYGHFCRRMYMPNCSGDEKWHIDLPSVCRHQLLDAGITDIVARNECTYQQFPRFYSARRMKEELGDHRIFNCISL
jgi:hypothetical protein